MEKSQTLTAQSLSPQLGVIFGVLAAASLISIYSGYHAFKAPFELEWQFSPIGLLQGVSPQNAAIPSAGNFAGTPGPTFDYLIVFLKTCLFESPFYWACFRKRPALDVIAILLGANFATHPIVFFVLPLLFQKYLSAALAGEAFAPIIEMAIAALLLARLGCARSTTGLLKGALWILLANLFSWEVGMFL
jgi:hypothetical protein